MLATVSTAKILSAYVPFTEVGPTIGVGKLRAFRAIRSTAVLLASVVAMLALATIVWSDAPANADSHPDGVTVTEVLRSPGLVVLRLTHTAGTSADFTLVPLEARRR